MKNIMGYIWILLALVLGIKSCQMQDHALICVGDNLDFSKMNKDIEEITIIGAKSLKVDMSFLDMTSVKSMTVNSDVLEDIEQEFFSKFLVNAEKSSLSLNDIPIKLEKKHLYRLNKLKTLIIKNVNDIADDAFEDLSSLDDLTIVNYTKDRLPTSIEKIIKDLKTLSIQSSEIEKFPWNTFNYFVGLKNPCVIDLLNTPINCGDKDFLNMFKSHQADIMNEKLLINGICSEPKDFKNKLVREISNDGLKQLMSIETKENIDDGFEGATTKASTEIIAVSIAISILLILLIAGLIAFKMCRGRNKHRDFQKSSSHTQQIESNYEPIRNDLMI